MISRRRVARYLADGLAADRRERITQVAAWLSANHRTHEATYLARDVAALLAADGYVAATATTARPLSPSATTAITKRLTALTGATTIELSTVVDSDVIGGLQLELPTSELDNTIRTKLTNFRTEASQ